MTEKLFDSNTMEKEIEEKKRNLKENYREIRENIAAAAKASGRKPEDITLLAATKTVPAEVINYGISLGIDYLGENKVQEFLSKYDEYDKKRCHLQFIGHLQTNKVKQIVGKVELIQSVDSVKLAREIAKCSQRLGIVTDVLVEVNIGGEENKSGVKPEEAKALLREISQIQGILVKGLMAIPPICEKNSEIRRYFTAMRKLFIDIRGENIDNITMDILSMGMSSDYMEAIEEGATMVRVGSSLFGARSYPVK